MMYTTYFAKVRSLPTSVIPELAPSWDSITAFKKSDDLPRGDIAFVCHRSILAEWLKENFHLGVCEWGDKP